MALFVVSFFALRLLTDTISQVKVRFPKIVEQIGSGIFGVVLGGVMVGFTLTTLYAVPLGKTFLFGGFRPGQAMVLGMAHRPALAGIRPEHVVGPLVPLGRRRRLGR